MRRRGSRAEAFRQQCYHCYRICTVVGGAVTSWLSCISPGRAGGIERRGTHIALFEEKRRWLAWPMLFRVSSEIVRQCVPPSSGWLVILPMTITLEQQSFYFSFSAGCFEVQFRDARYWKYFANRSRRSRLSLGVVQARRGCLQYLAMGAFFGNARRRILLPKFSNVR